MSRKQEVLTAVGTLACAVGIGFVMQNGQDAQIRYGKPVIVPKVQGSAAFPQRDQTTDAAFAGSILSVQDITLTSANVPPLPVVPRFDAPIETSKAPKSSLETPDIGFLGSGCAIHLTATPSAAAMVNLSLDAPCLPNERLSVLHKGMSVTYVTTKTGQLNVALPAFANEAVFEVAFSGGLSARAATTVDTLDLYDRVAVQWTGEDAVQLHAREFGARYGDSGHVWSGAARDLNAAASGNGGFLTRHGHPDVASSHQIEVYTFPKAMSQASGQVVLTIEAEVTQQTCGHDIGAKTLQLDSSGEVTVRDIVLTVPDCNAIGDFLVLNNLLQDLRVAQR
jgi:hypothetical protein